MEFKTLSKEDAKKELSGLIENFQNNIRYYEQPSYKESRVETEYIERLFELLGWDIRNLNGLSDIYKDVIKRDTVEIEGHAKEPDYAFTIGGNRIFFVEAKKPADSIESGGGYAFQLRRYAWNSKKPISILTNFKEFSVYDCRIKPNKQDKASVGRVFYVKFEDYIKNFDFIFDTFSKGAVLKGSLERYVETSKIATSEVDDAFLVELEQWRVALAKNIAAKNEKLSVYELNYTIQKILDRILFLRIAEDKNIEPQEKLRTIAKSNNVYKDLVDYFQDADGKYNSGLFDFKTDTITSSIKVDNEVLMNIIENLYYPNSPYDFKILSIEILGSAYERFLGKTIRLTEGHRVKVEEKPEVKKAGGIYYTPPFVVDYIIKNTVGKILENRTPNSSEKLRVLDPACGSGTFLVRAYTYILDWYLQYYFKDPKRYKNKMYQLQDGRWSLTTDVRKKILLDNIFGVDIDQQAVEITKLSLLLKVLENETQESINRQLKLFKERALPNIDRNIRCGNSIVNSTYFNQTSLNSNNEELQKINPFDWEDKERGFGYLGEVKFDVIIGNPPYIKEYTSREPFEAVKQTDLKKYYQGKMDLWYIFTCKAIDLLRDHGLHSFIALNNWITNSGASILRNKVFSETKLLSFFDFNDYQVFKKKASNQTMVFILKKDSIPKYYQVEYSKITNKNITKDELISNFNLGKTTNKIESYKVIIEPLKVRDTTITFTNSRLAEILTKIADKGNYALKEGVVSTGIDIHQDFVVDKHLTVLKDPSLKGCGIFNLSDKEYHDLLLDKKEKEIVKPFYSTEQLFRYYGNPKNKLWVIYSDINVRKNINQYPHIKDHLDKFKKVITSDFAPYGLHRAREQKFFEGEKIVSLRKTSKPYFTYTDFPCYVSQTYFVIKPDDIDLKYFVGLLNSNLMFFWLKYKGKKQGEQLQIDKAPLLKLPIYKPDTTNKAEKETEQEIIKFVDKLRELTKESLRVKIGSEKELIQKQLVAYEHRIDELVYKLYGITEEEKKIIEESLK
jgi:adenine-specific DNA-methyltransferase